MNLEFDSDSFGWVFWVIALAVVGAVAYISYLIEKRRREAFMAMAKRLGLRYTAKNHNLASKFGFLDKLCEGSNRYAFNILDGTYKEHPVCLFDYHYETYSTDSKGRRQTHHHYFSFFILEHAAHFPELRIYPEGLFSKLGQALGFDDIDFESIEFSKSFVVKSSDKKFAYDICHTRMMEHFLKNRSLSLEIEGNCVATWADSRLAPEEVPGRLEQLIVIRSLFPDYLYAT